MSSRLDGEGDFYRLSFASQMIVWAVRRRLHLLGHGEDDGNVSTAFQLAGLDELYTALMSIVDVLLIGTVRKIQLHAVSCPCLAPHEIVLLDALASLQREQDEQARRRMGDLTCEPAVRLVFPAMRVIVRELDAQGLRLTRSSHGLDASAVCPRGSRVALH